MHIALPQCTYGKRQIFFIFVDSYFIERNFFYMRNSVTLKSLDETTRIRKCMCFIFLSSSRPLCRSREWRIEQNEDNKTNFIVQRQFEQLVNDSHAKISYIFASILLEL